MEKIDKKFFIPEKREDRISRLEEATKILKEEFVGLDEIIDRIKISITPWYITPEIITRPTVISLWGMTGTGKTSVVKRLIDLLGLANKAIFFDCGEESNTGTRTVGEKINDVISIDDEEEVDRESPNDLVFVFDEFQHARTLNERGEEIDKPNLRSVWNLLDTGILRFDDYNYELSYFNSFLEDFSEYAKEYPNVPLDRGKVTERENVKTLLENLGYFYYDRNLNALQDRRIPKITKNSLGSQDDEEEDALSPINILDSRVIRVLIRRFKKSNKALKTPDIINEILGIKTVGEMSEYLKVAKKSMTAMKEMNCNKSIIFVLGNLDEAFGVEGELNPDIDADVFYDRTSKVSITDIKNALKERFRAEQIARFGNSIIKYPTLRKADFMKVIHKETSKVCSDFERATKYKISIEPEVYDLLYSEGVYPVQGVRPIFTTVGTIFTPLFSDIVMNFPEASEVTLGIKDPETGYKIDEKTILIRCEEKIIERVVTLTLGALRKPESKKTRYINAVHETGHAIVMAWTTGKLPMSIVAISSESGGFCLTYDPDKTGEIETKRDVENSVMISMAGYLAEELMYPDEGMRLMGSGSDIDAAWEEFSRAAYKGGYYKPYSFCNYETYGAQLPGGMRDTDIQNKIKETFRTLRQETKKILSDNKGLLRDVALRLGTIGEMKEDEFRKYIERDQVFVDRLEEVRKLNSPEYYKEMIFNDILEEVKKEGE